MSIRSLASWTRGRAWPTSITTRLLHAQALLCTAPGVCAFEGDLLDPPGILGHPDLRAVIDLGAPVAIVLAAVLHFIPGEDSAHKLVDMLTAAVAPGSYLVISHATNEDIGADTAGQVQELYAQASAPAVFRSRRTSPFTTRYARGTASGSAIPDYPTST